MDKDYLEASQTEDPTLFQTMPTELYKYLSSLKDSIHSRQQRLESQKARVNQELDYLAQLTESLAAALQLISQLMPNGVELRGGVTGRISNEVKVGRDRNY